MKLALILATLTLAAPARAADSVAYVDAARVYQEASEAKRIAAELQRDRETKQAEINAAQDAVAKAKPADRKAAQDKAAKLTQMDSADFQVHADKAAAEQRAGLAKVVSALKRERHVATVLPVVPIDPKPGSDWTDEVIKRWDASVAPTAEEVAALKAQVAQLKAEKAALTKPAPPAVPDPPPSRPPTPVAKR